MKRLPLIVLVALVALSACKRHRPLSDALRAADAVVCTAPDSALAILSLADTSGAPERLRALYVLLSEKASHKAYIYNTDDSLISAAARFYQGRNDSLEAQALYYKGVVQFNNRDYGRALISLMQAHDVAARADDRFYKAMSSRTLADTYRELLSFDAAARYDSLSIIEFYEAGRPIYAAFEKEALPFYLIQSRRVDDAIKILEGNALDSFFLSSPYSIAQQYQNLALAYFHKHNYPQAAEMYDSCLLKAPDVISSVNCSYGAWIQSLLNNVDRGNIFLDIALSKAKEYEDTLFYNLAKAHVLAAEGNYKSAFELHDNTYNHYNSVRNQLLSHPYTTVLTDYFKTLSDDREQSLETERMRNYLLLALLALVITLAGAIYLLYKRRNRINEILRENLLRDIDQLRNELSALELIGSTDSDSNENAVNADSSFIRLIDNLFSIEESAPTSDEGNAILRKTFRSVLDSLRSNESFKTIESLANLYSNNIIAKLRTEVSSMTENQLRYFALYALGFSNTSICYILSINNLNSIHQLRSRIRSNIKSAQTANKDLFLAILAIKKNS